MGGFRIQDWESSGEPDVVEKSHLTKVMEVVQLRNEHKVIGTSWQCGVSPTPLRREHVLTCKKRS
jgi:hypothetical protein